MTSTNNGSIDTAEAGTKPLAVRLAARPARVGVFVPVTSDHEWLAGIDPLDLLGQALAVRSSVWGGSGHLLFPMSADADELLGHELFWALAEVFDADSYLLPAFTGDDLRDLAPERAIEVLDGIDAAWEETGQSDVAQKDFLESPIEDRRFSPALHEALVRRLAPLHFQEDLSTSGTDLPWNTVEPPGMQVTDLADLPSSIAAPTTNLGPVGKLLLGVEAGRLTERDADRFKARGVALDAATYNDPASLHARLFPTSAPSAPEPWAIGEAGCTWYMTRRQYRQPTIVVVGDDPWDFALFYALRRMTGQAYWIPTSLIDDRGYGSRLARVLRAHSRRLALTLRFTSFSDSGLAQAAHAGLARALGQQLPVEFVHWSETIPPEPNRLFGTDQYGRDEPVLLHGGRTTPLQTPTINEARAIQDTQTTWIVDADVDGWRPIRHFGLGQEVLDSPARSTSTQRCSMTGPSYIATTSFGPVGSSLETLTVRPAMRPLDLTAQLQIAAAARGWRVEPSDKGAYARRAEAIFGPLRELAGALRRPAIAAALGAYLAPSSDKEALGWFSAADRRRYLSLEHLQSIIGDGTDALVNELRVRGALAIGSLLKCSRCRQAAWYDVDDFGRNFVCSRCRFEQAADNFSWLDRPEPVWSYRLDEALRQFLEHDGDLPALAAADLLAKSVVPTAAAYELELVDPHGVKSELDIALSDGATLWVGESTISPRLERTNRDEAERLSRLHQVADVLTARHVLLVNSGKWNEGTLSRAHATFRRPWPTLHVVESAERALATS